MAACPGYGCHKLMHSASRRGAGTHGTGGGLTVHMGIVWALRALVILAFPVAFIVVFSRPSLGLDATGTGTPLVVGSTFILMKKAGPLHQCPGRHQGRRVLWGAITDSQRRLDQYDGLFRALGLSPAERARKRDLKLIQGGDSSPGRRVSLSGHLGGLAALVDAQPSLREPDHPRPDVRREIQFLDRLQARVIIVAPALAGLVLRGEFTPAQHGLG